MQQQIAYLKIEIATIDGDEFLKYSNLK